MELVVIALVAIVVVGPQKLPEVMKQLGRFFVQARRYTNDVRSQVQTIVDDAERELRMEELDRLRAELKNASPQKLLESALDATPAKDHGADEHHDHSHDAHDPYHDDDHDHLHDDHDDHADLDDVQKPQSTKAPAHSAAAKPPLNAPTSEPFDDQHLGVKAGESQSSQAEPAAAPEVGPNAPTNKS
jgi:sec-independent protein translocase protein TatB